MKNEEQALHYQDASTLAESIRAKRVSSREVVQAHLDRIATVNPKLNAVVTLMAETALKTADDADRAVARGDAVGALHGVPFSIKDALDTAGVATKRGSLLFADHVPEKDATAVTRFKAAGAIPLMKTNIPEFSFWTETDNRVTGRTNNPWNLERTPGGSSGGESASLASGMSPIGIGSDVMISVRGPAAFTGIAALKATHGRVPYTGHYPQVLSHWWHVGAMARSVRDVALGYSLLQGPDGKDGYAVYPKDAHAAHERIDGRRLRVGWVSDASFGPVDPEITSTIKAAAGQLTDAGYDVDEVELPSVRSSYDALGTLVYGELAPVLKKLTAGRESELHPVAASIIAANSPSFADFAAAHAQVETMRAVFAKFFARYDILLCPVNPMTATRHGLSEHVVNGQTVPWTHVMTATAPFNLTGLPALSVPYALSSENLPINLQLVGTWFDEATILRTGQLLERRGGLGNKRPPIA